MIPTFCYTTYCKITSPYSNGVIVDYTPFFHRGGYISTLIFHGVLVDSIRIFQQSGVGVHTLLQYVLADSTGGGGKYYCGADPGWNQYDMAQDESSRSESDPAADAGADGTRSATVQAGTPVRTDGGSAGSREDESGGSGEGDSGGDGAASETRGGGRSRTRLTGR
jgi:hypothetical protein